MSSQSLSKEEIDRKYRHNIINYINAKLALNNRILNQVNKSQAKDRNFKQQYDAYDQRDTNKDGKVSNEEKGVAAQKQISDEHKKQFADAINDLKENTHKGKWVPQTLTDTHVKGDGGRER